MFVSCRVHTAVREQLANSLQTMFAGSVDTLANNEQRTVFARVAVHLKDLFANSRRTYADAFATRCNTFLVNLTITSVSSFSL